MSNQLVRLYLFEWQRNSIFSLVVELDAIDAELASANPPHQLAARDTTSIRVLNASNQVLEEQVLPPTISITDRSQRVAFPSLMDIRPGNYTVQITVKTGTESGVDPVVYNLPKTIIQVPDPTKNLVELEKTSFPQTTSSDLWEAIKQSRLNFHDLKRFVDGVLCKPITHTTPAGCHYDFDPTRVDMTRVRLPFVNVDEYALIKYAIDAYMRDRLHLRDNAGTYSLNPLPYYQSLQSSLFEILSSSSNSSGRCCDALAAMRRNGFFAIELIWSYWTEQAMLVQALGAISLRYQNIRGLHEVEPMMRFDTSPLMPLSNMMWGFIQDEQHRTSLHRRVFEYQHAYNLRLVGKAVPRQVGVDNRSNFLAAFHQLLHQASLFYKEYDDTTRKADAFPLLIALRDVHLLLAEGNHNAYHNMTYSARHEMLTMQYLLAQPEMQVFLGGRPMLPVEPHIGVLDTVKTIQGWDPMGTMHYYDLANTGEQLLLSIRYGDWNATMYTAADAGNWAIAFRDLISTYINAYRNVTMIDLSADAMRTNLEERATQPALLIRRRMQLSSPQRAFAAR